MNNSKNDFPHQQCPFSWRVACVAGTLAIIPVVSFLVSFVYPDWQTLSVLGLLTLIVLVIFPIAIPVAGCIGFLFAALLSLLSIRHSTCNTASLCDRNVFRQVSPAMKTFAVHMTLVSLHLALWVHLVPYVLAHRPIVPGLHAEMSHFFVTMYSVIYFRGLFACPLGIVLLFFIEYRTFYRLYQDHPKLANGLSAAVTVLLTASLLVSMVCLAYVLNADF